MLTLLTILFANLYPVNNIAQPDCAIQWAGERLVIQNDVRTGIPIYNFVYRTYQLSVDYTELIQRFEEEHSASLESALDIFDELGFFNITCFNDLLFITGTNDTGFVTRVLDTTQSFDVIAEFTFYALPFVAVPVTETVIAMTVFVPRYGYTTTVIDLSTSTVLKPIESPGSFQDWVTLVYGNYIMVNESYYHTNTEKDYRSITYHLYELQEDKVIPVTTCSPVLIPEDGNDQFSPYALLSPDGLIVPSYVSPITYKVGNCDNINDILLNSQTP